MGLPFGDFRSQMMGPHLPIHCLSHFASEITKFTPHGISLWTGGWLRWIIRAENCSCDNSNSIYGLKIYVYHTAKRNAHGNLLDIFF
jgi:hypothetical protein